MKTHEDIVYKLTDENCETRGKTKWGPSVTHSGTGKGDLCGPGFIHAYTHPLLAIFLNPIHAAFKKPRLWEATTTIAKNDRGLKVGGVSLTTIREISLPVVTIQQRVLFALLCCSKLNVKTEYQEQIEKALSCVRRKDYADAAYAARAAADAAYAAARAADAAADAAARAAYAAADAARAAYAAADAARAAYAAADAARAAYAAADAAPTKTLIEIAEEAVKEISE